MLHRFCAFDVNKLFTNIFLQKINHVSYADGEVESSKLSLEYGNM